MQETPPDSVLEIKLLLSQYLDGALDPAKTQAVEQLLTTDPRYASELEKLKAAQAMVQSTLIEPEANTNEESVSSPLWAKLADQLKADAANSAQDVDPEFISAYYDGEISKLTPEYQAFESQLFQNDKASQTLAELGEVSEAVRQFGYRLESSCSVDVTQSVMAAFQQEKPSETVADHGHAGEQMADEPVDETAETLSAYVDQALSPREVIEANRLIESDSQAKRTLTQFNRLSGHIQSISEQIQAQAPDVWPSMETILRQPPEAGGLVLSMNKYKKRKAALRFGLPVAAAVALVMLVLPAAPVKDALNASSQPVAGTTLVNYETNSDAVSLASLPMTSSRGAALTPVMHREPIFTSTSTANLDRVAPKRPIFEPAGRRIAVRPNDMTRPSKARAAASAPSSEEYLFNALSEQMPNEDISAILGK